MCHVKPVWHINFKSHHWNKILRTWITEAEISNKFQHYDRNLLNDVPPLPDSTGDSHVELLDLIQSKGIIICNNYCTKIAKIAASDIAKKRPRKRAKQHGSALEATTTTTIADDMTPANDLDAPVCGKTHAIDEHDPADALALLADAVGQVEHSTIDESLLDEQAESSESELSHGNDELRQHDNGDATPNATLATTLASTAEPTPAMNLKRKLEDAESMLIGNISDGPLIKRIKILETACGIDSTSQEDQSIPARLNVINNTISSYGFDFS